MRAPGPPAGPSARISPAVTPGRAETPPRLSPIGYASPAFAGAGSAASEDAARAGLRPGAGLPAKIVVGLSSRPSRTVLGRPGAQSGRFPVTQQQAAPLLPEPSPRCPVGTSHRRDKWEHITAAGRGDKSAPDRLRMAPPEVPIHAVIPAQSGNPVLRPLHPHGRRRPGTAAGPEGSSRRHASSTGSPLQAGMTPVGVEGDRAGGGGNPTASAVG